LRNCRLELLRGFLIQKKKLDPKEKAEQYSKEQDKKETRHLVNIEGIDRSIEEWDVE
jgi:hypothetical protein